MSHYQYVTVVLTSIAWNIRLPVRPYRGHSNYPHLPISLLPFVPIPFVFPLFSFSLSVSLSIFRASFTILFFSFWVECLVGAVNMGRFQNCCNRDCYEMLWSLRFSTVKSFFIFLQFFSITSRGNGRFFVLVLLLSLVIFWSLNDYSRDCWTHRLKRLA